MIPKKIHYIWLGKNRKSNLVNMCIHSWHEKMPDFEIIEWNEDNLNIEEICEQNKFFSECEKRKLWAFMADYLRLKILYENGGIYFDTDVEVLKDMNVFLKNSYIFGMENNVEVSSAVIACEKHNPIIKEILNFYDKKIWDEHIYIITQIMTKVINKQKENIKIYPKDTFSPIQYGETFEEKCIKDNTYTIHWFNATWNEKIQVCTFLEIKHIKNPIKRYCMFIKKYIGYYYRKMRRWTKK